MTFLLNAALVVATLNFALLFTVRHAHWGPEGPVGAGLLLIPFVGIPAIVLATLIVRRVFAWVPGGHLTSFSAWIGVVVAFAVTGYYAMSVPATTFERVAALCGWLLLAGCFVAVNARSSTASTALIVATLGVGGVAGWVQCASWLKDQFDAQDRALESQIAHDREFQDQLEAEFRALGKDAPLWKYFGCLYNANEEIRKQCREIMATRADRDARLSEYLDNEILANSATQYIAELHPAPGRELASALARRSDLLLSQLSDLDPASARLSERSYADVRDATRAVIRIHDGGNDLTPQLDAWRRYLARFKNAGDLVAPLDQALKQPNARKAS